MTCSETSALIDRVAASLRPHLTEEAADAVATEVVGEITSRFYLIPIPAEAEEDAARAEINSIFPGFFTNAPTKGRT